MRDVTIRWEVVLMGIWTLCAGLALVLVIFT